uniref:Uncharacterized protein n=1 Tax=Anguilla anguilla TaxID=7936 RepID=A0A0E9QC40_ANGAN
MIKHVQKKNKITRNKCQKNGKVLLYTPSVATKFNFQLKHNSASVHFHKKN